MSKSRNSRNKYLTTVSAFIAATACKGDSAFSGLTGGDQPKDADGQQQVQRILEVPADVMSTAGFENLMENLNDTRFYDVVKQSKQAGANIKQLAEMTRDNKFTQISDNIVTAMRSAVNATGSVKQASLSTAAARLSEHMRSKYPAALEYLKAYTKANPMSPAQVKAAENFLHARLAGGANKNNGFTLADDLELSPAGRAFAGCVKQLVVNCGAFVNVYAVASVYVEVATSGSKISGILRDSGNDDGGGN